VPVVIVMLALVAVSSWAQFVCVINRTHASAADRAPRIIQVLPILGISYR
jgi:hypothetical protein